MAQPLPPAPVPAGPAPGVRFGGAVARLIAYWIDGFVAGFVSLAVTAVFGIIAGIAGANDLNVLAGGSVIVLILAVLAVAFLYFPYFWVKNAGQTPGMRVMRIRVVRDVDGGPIGWSSAILRLIGYWISAIVFYLGFIWIFIDARKRGWHDLIAGTCVVEV